MDFVKMEGLGNDYIYVNCMEGAPPDLPALARTLSDRHFGVGADGLICIRPGVTGDFAMEMYNADGSRGAMCGNGIRCVGKLVYDSGLTKKRCLTIDTDAGPRTLELSVFGGKVRAVAVDMGEISLDREVIMETEWGAFSAVPARAGNPHAVIFCDDPWAVELERVGPVLERHPALPERSNIEFAACPDREHIRLRVWERGSGITLACGTGACAAFAAARRKNRCGDRAEAALPGGKLALEWRKDHVWMTGPARTVFWGRVDLPGENS